MEPELYDYQIDAVNRMKNGCILYGDTGCGKSRTALAYYFVKECNGVINGLETGFEEDQIPMENPKKLYIITTARKRDTFEWEKECIPFGIPCYEDSPLYSFKTVIDSWNNISKYSEVTDSFFIFDEQRVTGEGPWVKAFLKICKSNRWILLSATPGDCWKDYVPVFVANGYFKNKTEFYRRHAIYNPYTRWREIIGYLGESILCKYRNEILVKIDYTHEAISHHTDILVDYDTLLYKTIMKNRWDVFENKPIENASSLCYLLRKVVNSDESRIVSVLEIAEKHEKLIIFYNFDYELELLKNAGYLEGTEIAEWNGHKHEPIPKSERWIYLVQYIAGAEGWNCIVTDALIFYSQSYSYKLTIQAAGRIDRANTPFKNLFYYHLRSTASIDLAITRALKTKRNFNEKKFVSF